MRGYNEKQISRIKKMEARLTECRKATDDLSDQIGRMEALKDEMTELFRYYGSEEWYEDREIDLPEDLSTGVLSEDMIYDEITDIRDAAFRMIELGTDILKNRI